MKDPLTILTVIVALGFLALLGKYILTDKLDKELFGLVTTLLGTLVTLATTRKKDDTPKDPPSLPPPSAAPTPDSEPLPPVTTAPPEVSDAP